MSRAKERVVPERNIYSVAVERLGLRRGIRVLNFVQMWNLAEIKIGHRINVPEYSKHWGMQHQNVYREMAFYRTAFPEVEISDLCAHMRRRYVDGGGLGSFERAEYVWNADVKAS